MTSPFLANALLHDSFQLPRYCAEKIAYIYTKRIADTLRKHFDKPIAD